MGDTSTPATGPADMILVSNIAPNASIDQMREMFTFIGEIDDIVMYPDDDIPTNQSKVCYIRFKDKDCVPVAQHLTNTVFIDRALVVQPHVAKEMPDAVTALNQTAGIAFSGGSNSGLMSQIVPGVSGTQVISTIDPRLTALGLAQYPPLPATTDPSRVEEIRRTVYVGNLDSKLSAETVLEYFNAIGEVKWVRMAGDETQPTRFAFVEFTDQSSVANALQYNGAQLANRPLKINHSNNAIVKTPIIKPALNSVSPHDTNSLSSSHGHHKHHHNHNSNNSRKDHSLDETMRKVREAQSQITAAIEQPAAAGDYVIRKRSRSRDRDRDRDKDRDRGRDRRRDRDRRSEERISSTRDRKKRSRSRSKERRRRSRSRDRERDRKEKDRDRERDRDRDRDRERDRDRIREKEKRKRSRSRSRSRSRDRRERRNRKERSEEKRISPSTEIPTN